MSQPFQLCAGEYPTREELDAAWSTLHRAGIEAILDVSLGEFSRIITSGLPGIRHANDQYSDAERRFACAILLLRARLVERDEVIDGLVEFSQRSSVAVAVLLTMLRKLDMSTGADVAQEILDDIEALVASARGDS